MKVITVLSFMISMSVLSIGQSLTAKEVVQKMDDNAFGGRLKSTMKMTIIRPTWTRTMALKSWADGDDYSLILITSPAR